MDFSTDDTFGFTIRDEIPTSSATGTASQLYHGLESASELAAVGNAGAAERLSAAIVGAEPSFLVEAVQTDPRIVQRNRVLASISNSASPAALLKLANATSVAYEQPLSPVMSALLSKLAHEAETLPSLIRVAADHSFRDLFKYMVETWSASTIASASQGQGSVFSDTYVPEFKRAGSVTPEPERVLSLAFETGAAGTMVWHAAAKIAENPAGARKILSMLTRAPANSDAARTIAKQFSSPHRLTMLLHEDPVDFAIVDALLGRIGADAAPALVDAVAESKTRETRRSLLDRLVALGPQVAPLVASKLRNDNRWYVQRNMLMVLREANCGTAGVNLDDYTSHADARVRREATFLQFSDPVGRDRAIAEAIRGDDRDALKIGLKAARANMPETVVPILAKRVVDPAFPGEFRVPALQLLARSSSVLALEPLLRYSMGGTTLLGKPKLAAKSTEMLIALGGLARNWSSERRAAPLIALAMQSKDPAISGAVSRTARVEAEPDSDND